MDAKKAKKAKEVANTEVATREAIGCIGSCIDTFLEKTSDAQSLKEKIELERARAICHKKRMIKRRSRVSPIKDGRRLCRGVHRNGNPCTYRAKRNDGYCERHNPQGPAKCVDDKRRRSYLQDREKNEYATARVIASQDIMPACPNCKEDTLLLDLEKKYFGMRFALCTNCFKRTSLTVVDQLIEKQLQAKLKKEGRSSRDEDDEEE